MTTTAMVKHESLSNKARSDASDGDCNAIKQTTKRGVLWRMRSLSEAPTERSTPRSQITKALDYFPWSRGKRNAESKAKSPSTTKSNDYSASTVNVNVAESSNKNSTQRYQRNIFRSGGFLIRDMLSERGTTKEKISNSGHSSQISSKNAGNNNSKFHQKNLKHLTMRNKSLDINEFINDLDEKNYHLNDSVEQNNGDNNTLKRSSTNKQRFLDDTYVEVLQHGQQRNSGWYQEIDDDETIDASVNSTLNAEFYDPETGFYQKSPPPAAATKTEAPLRSSFHTIHRSNSASKRILFNDDNMVYPIKKEQPVAAVSRRKSSKNMDSTKSTKKTSSSGSDIVSSSQRGSFRNSNSNNKNNEQSSILRARLKFKKLTPQADTFMSPENEALNASTSTSLSRNNEAIAKSSNSIAKDFSRSSRRGILQRQNTSPALVQTIHNNIKQPSPTLGLNQGGSIRQRSGDKSRHRRKSLTEVLSHEKQQLLNTLLRDQQIPSHQQQQQPQRNSQYYNQGSSSSSIGSASANNHNDEGSVTTELPRTEKPRKKLSFREPVVTEKDQEGRLRRRSTPLQRFSMDAGLNFWEADPENEHMRGKNSITESIKKRYTLQNQNSLDFVAACDDKESQAMRIVRTVGQAFEVCHKFNFHKNSVDHNNDERSDVSSELLDVERISEKPIGTEETNKKGQLTTSVDMNQVHQSQRPQHLELITCGSQTDAEKSPATTPTSSPSHEIIKLKDQLEQQALQTRQALAQLMLVREQLISETNARIEAQARTQQLLQQNRELLEHLVSLGAYNEHQTPSLNSPPNIAMTPQSQLQMLLQATNNNNNLATINQQISNLGNINQQLNSLSHQLSGLNQQSQNLQNFQSKQNMNTNLQQQQQQQQQQQSPQPKQQQSNVSSLSSIIATPNNMTAAGHSSTSPYPSMSQMQTISNQLQQMNAQSTQQKLQQDTLSNDLMQVNQELLNRLQSLSLSSGAGGEPITSSSLQAVTTPHNSFFYVNPISCSPQPGINANNNNNNGPSNLNFLNSSTSLLSSNTGAAGNNNNGNCAGNTTPSPLGSLNRNSYIHNPIADLESFCHSMDKNINRVDELSLLSELSSVPPQGNLADSTSTATTTENSHSTSTIDSQSSPRSRSVNDTPFIFNTVTLKVTDEAGNVTNQRKLSAKPSFITRSTSEKAPNRSQIMNEVHRTTWARHTTK